MATGYYSGQVSPFGYPWLKARLRLPMAFRSLPRPSSAISALASTLCSYSLNLPYSTFLYMLQVTPRYFALLSLSLCSFQGAGAVLENDIAKNFMKQPFLPAPASSPARRPSPAPSEPPLDDPSDLGSARHLPVPRVSLERR